MSNENQSQGRDENDAIPESEAQSRAGKTGQVAGEGASFKPDYGSIPAPNDFEGPAGDPVEGPR